jgi:hypothetical protein
MIKMEGLQARELSSRVTLLARLGLQSHPQLGIFAKFAPSFVKLPKLQTPNAKPLDTFFWSFLANYSNANLKCKTLGDALEHLQGFGKLTWHLLLFANSHNKM